jgi:hypothetical protein
MIGLGVGVKVKYTIIEDCSPYYIRFTHDGINDLVKYCQSLLSTEVLQTPVNEFQHKHYVGNFKNLKLTMEQSKKILDILLPAKQLNFIKERVSLFITKPGFYYRAHKDGKNHRCSLNYTIQILDDKCVTSWYNDKDLKDYNMDPLHLNSRECLGFVKENHNPVKTMVAQPNEAILFNTEIFHDWDNTNSENYRVVLTLRSQNPGDFYFDDVKKLLFESKD